MFQNKVVPKQYCRRRLSKDKKVAKENGLKIRVEQISLIGINEICAAKKIFCKFLALQFLCNILSFPFCDILYHDIFTVCQAAVCQTMHCAMAMHVEMYCLSFYLNYTRLVENDVPTQSQPRTGCHPSSTLQSVSVYKVHPTNINRCCVCALWQNLQLSCDYDPLEVEWYTVTKIRLNEIKYLSFDRYCKNAKIPLQ